MLCVHKDGKSRGTTLFHLLLTGQTSQVQPDLSAVSGGPGAAYLINVRGTAPGGLQYRASPPHTNRRLSAQDTDNARSFHSIARYYNAWCRKSQIF